jgi:hypothetical protein
MNHSLKNQVAIISGSTGIVAFTMCREALEPMMRQHSGSIGSSVTG